MNQIQIFWYHWKATDHRILNPRKLKLAKKSLGPISRNLKHANLSTLTVVCRQHAKVRGRPIAVKWHVNFGFFLHISYISYIFHQNGHFFFKSVIFSQYSYILNRRESNLVQSPLDDMRKYEDDKRTTCRHPIMHEFWLKTLKKIGRGTQLFFSPNGGRIENKLSI